MVKGKFPSESNLSHSRMKLTYDTSTFTTLGTTKCEISSRIFLRQEEIYGLCDNVELRTRENVEECVDRQCLLSERAIICSWIFSGERNKRKL